MPHTVRRDLRPGDLGRAAALHGRVYADEHGLDASFEAMVARGLAEATLGGWPGPHEGWWAVEDDDGELVGCLAFTDEGGGLARVRWFVLDASARGAGLGARMLDELLDEVRAHGYERVELVTFSDLQAAAHRYRSRGFALLSSEPRDLWGRTLVYQHYELQVGSPHADLNDERPPRL
jgi:GNAT superfamily N-acetyltransferase